MNTNPPEHHVHEKISKIYDSHTKLLKYGYHISVPVSNYQNIYYQTKTLNSNETVK